MIKSASVSGTATAQKWSYIVAENEPTTMAWGPPPGTAGANDLSATDNVIVIQPMSGTTSLRVLVMNGSAFSTTYSPFSSSFSPATISENPLETYLIYGIASAADGPVTMPFNRADYFVGIPTAALMPTRCASGTGVLYKAVLRQNGTFDPNYTTPLLDCVADMQVVFGLDMNGDGIIGTYSNADGTYATDATNITGQAEGQAANVPSILQGNSNLSAYRSALVEVRVYILAHEGQMDPNYTYPSNSVLVGESIFGAAASSLGRTFNFGSSGIANWQNYRWKVYTIVVELQNRL